MSIIPKINYIIPTPPSTPLRLLARRNYSSLSEGERRTFFTLIPKSTANTFRTMNKQLIMVLLFITWFGGIYALADHHDNVIRITARIWQYDPPQIEIKKGVHTIIELISLDRLHGFNIPEFKLRADVMPGKTIRIELTPQKAGRYPFLCDIFCGDGHDEMNGVIVVTE